MRSERKEGQNNREGIIDLSNLSVFFCDNELLNSYYEKKLAEIEDEDKWIEDNRDNLLREKNKITQAVKDGIISDGEPETIWKFRVKKLEDLKDKLISIKNEAEDRLSEIKKEIALRLGKFLPDWKLKEANVNFTINEKADYCVDGTEITVDLGRLIHEENPIENVIEGITHELFHVWMEEEEKYSDSHQFSSRSE